MKLSFIFLLGLLSYSNLPLNEKVLRICEKFGHTISPTYEQAVCTEFVIGVLKHIYPVSQKEMRDIRIITNLNLDSLRLEKSPIIRGVQTALLNSGKGKIVSIENAEPGDFIQFWTGSWGHCGIIYQVNKQEKTMQLYSSFPSTNGFGIQDFEWTDEMYLVRLI